jgi:hypothetical protein
MAINSVSTYTDAEHDDFEDLDNSNTMNSVAKYRIQLTTFAILDKELVSNPTW